MSENDNFTIENSFMISFYRTFGNDMQYVITRANTANIKHTHVKKIKMIFLISYFNILYFCK